MGSPKSMMSRNSTKAPNSKRTFTSEINSRKIHILSEAQSPEPTTIEINQTPHKLESTSDQIL